MNNDLCPICKHKMLYFDKAKVLNKYHVCYYKCSNCGYINTEKPYWLHEAYSRVITDSDVFLVGRNIRYSQRITALIRVFFPNNNTFLDYGGGYGIFVRIMRNNGLNFEWYDKYCDNIFAQNHEKKSDKYDIVTALEVFEHLENPQIEMNKLLDISRTIILSTQIIPNSVQSIKDWEYFGTEHGQHISFYTSESLKQLAKNHDKQYIGTKSIHIFSDRHINPLLFYIVVALAPLINAITKTKSLESYDYEIAKQGCMHTNT